MNRRIVVEIPDEMEDEEAEALKRAIGTMVSVFCGVNYT